MFIQFVKFESGLGPERVRETMESRAPEFRAVPGLVQKYYGREPDTGEYTGIYIWESEEALSACRQSRLAQTIPEACEVPGAPRVEAFEVLFSLRGAR